MSSIKRCHNLLYKVREFSLQKDLHCPFLLMNNQPWISEPYISRLSLHSHVLLLCTFKILFLTVFQSLFSILYWDSQQFSLFRFGRQFTHTPTRVSARIVGESNSKSILRQHWYQTTTPTTLDSQQFSLLIFLYSLKYAGNSIICCYGKQRFLTL